MSFIAGGKTVGWVSGFCTTFLVFIALLLAGANWQFAIGYALPAGLISGLITGIWMDKKTLQPLREFRNRIQEGKGNPADLTDDILADLENSLIYLRSEYENEIENLKQIETFRREFLGNVSHELKTPIFAIQGFIDTLLEGALEDERVNRSFLEKALKHADRLDNLVKDLLIISQLETGQLQMHMEGFRLHDLILEVFESLENKLTRKGRSIKLQLISNGNELLQVHADRERIRQVLINLVDNAIKYGDPQGIVSVEFQKHNGKRVIIRVKNQGQPIAPEHLPRLFERFYRVDKSRSREGGGTGLGLSIVKHLIEAHREKILVESEPEKGSTFTFTLKRFD